MDRETAFAEYHGQRPSWLWIAHRYPSGMDCLAAFIALEAAEVLAGEKPSVLIGVPDRARACGRNLHSLWLEHGAELMERTCLSAREIRRGAGFLQLLLSVPDDFSRFLARRDVSSLLRKAGYQEPFSAEHALDQLEQRMNAGTFPHEIGIFLGYPLKDVAAFMGWIRLPFACQGPWKMYGDPRASLGLAERFRACRRGMAERLAATSSALECVVSSSRSVESFLCP
ncbi:DUF3793 family protein [Pelobacter propionicus]|uniref:DUF3793 domain-containing protein n=1 Tax=Pelobacter propionicus (strain DSM 2379 / NBRC 103807 / OttBd1) TaxID=338966 RepID=A1AM48_PELPD|nr:DUF3793 family protein [Pelobacter propionicus]ABK98418.1 conserved hypothetical protein [Pelobacter propionicus DSM 2379]